LHILGTKTIRDKIARGTSLTGKTASKREAQHGAAEYLAPMTLFAALCAKENVRLEMTGLKVSRDINSPHGANTLGAAEGPRRVSGRVCDVASQSIPVSGSVAAPIVGRLQLLPADRVLEVG